MKLQLDTTAKTIKVEESVKLVKFMDTVKKLLPNNEWKEFTLQTNTTINYGSYPVYTPIWTQPWYDRPWINYCSNDTNMTKNMNVEEYKSSLGDRTENYSLNAGVYNIETKD